ncbi:hypothetical protein ACTZWW_11180 [Salinarimonas sp. NSM]|uniref:hypothetical protein n=1 Tax=Salinarimonas sp. NSM TaxID=3458003 RepID=UPI004035B5F3
MHDLERARVSERGAGGPAAASHGFSAAFAGAEITHTARAVADARTTIARITALLAMISGIELATARHLASVLAQISGELAVIAREADAQGSSARLAMMLARLTDAMQKLGWIGSAVARMPSAANAGAAAAGELAGLQAELAALLSTLQGLLARLASLR